MFVQIVDEAESLSDLDARLSQYDY